MKKEKYKIIKIEESNNNYYIKIKYNDEIYEDIIYSPNYDIAIKRIIKKIKNRKV